METGECLVVFRIWPCGNYRHPQTELMKEIMIILMKDIVII